MCLDKTYHVVCVQAVNFENTAVFAVIEPTIRITLYIDNFFRSCDTFRVEVAPIQISHMYGSFTTLVLLIVIAVEEL